MTVQLKIAQNNLLLKHKIPIKPAGTKGQKSITAQNHN
jgi:hypothetical protein